MELGKVKKVACIGEVMIELIPRADGSAQLGVAGDTFNTAVYMARALRGSDVSVSYVTALGSDPYSERIMAAIRSHGLKTDHIERRDGMMPGLYAVNTDDAGERSFSYWRSASAARTLFSEPCEVRLEALQEFDLVFLTGISLAILPLPVRAALMHWIDQYRAAGGVVAYDSNHRPRLWESTKTARETNQQMWSRTDIALPSLDDEMALFGDRNERAVLDRLIGYGIKRGALKRGARGPRRLGNGAELGALPPIEAVVDTTAAPRHFPRVCPVTSIQ